MRTAAALRFVLGLAVGVLIAVGGERLHAQSPAAGPPVAEAVPQESYVIAIQDVLNIVVWDIAELTAKFTVRPDGTVLLPLVGSLKAAGLTTAAFEAQLIRALADGFLREPRVAVTLDQFRGRRIFIFGNVGSPGTYPLTEGQTLIEALARVGYAAAAEAIIVRPKHAAGPTMPENSGDAEVLRVNLRELEKDVERGTLTRNLVLRDGDTIFLPRTDPTRAFVTGQVRSPGAYSITEGTTVLQALALAGGPTEDAAVNRIRITRLIKGKQEALKARLSDLVQPGDTIEVPERFF
jgi:polysaccharide export outer membrane protein